MIGIIKKTEPRLLTEYRLRPGAVYDGPMFTPVKDAIRKALLNEQGCICAYCMQRIHDNHLTTKIEHWHSQHSDLDYRMLLACCDGGHGNPPAQQHCDTHKGNNPLNFNPANLAVHVEDYIRYTADGLIRSDNELMQSDLAALNLNTPKLVRYRKEVFQAVTDELNKDNNQRTFQEIKRLIVKWRSRNRANEAKPFCGVAIYALQKRLKRS
jgi:uncharacterized protein (TIGR02646 family)